ncbi:unnamed protein product [Adineta steineri]|uniref:Uncharacterized protein n=1 Tax=Adineta steineri TaxID=433720 RepID=A0A814GIC7_9BILA|nr:unnamed protein product [Adineta steineri]CAF0996802.1 unnamed protein product [Adineta steineri]CAF1320014.1 unnamed protein product [Adineta steineri]
MDDDKKAIVVGLSAGIGGFVGVLILFCICWHLCCGSSEKETIQRTTRPIPVKQIRRTAPATTAHHNISTITPIKCTTISSDSKTNSTDDLASRLKVARQ